jgi:uncharacterized membrane protein
MRIAQMLLAVLALGLSVYALISGNNNYSSLMLLSLGAFMLITGLIEKEEKRQSTALLLIVSSLFVLFVSIYTIF